MATSDAVIEGVKSFSFVHSESSTGIHAHHYRRLQCINHVNARHHHREHGIDDDYESGSSCTTKSPLPALTEEVTTKRSTISRSAIWLGTYVVCRNLEAVSLAAATLTNPKACAVHDKPVQLCTACFLQQRRPAFPFRLYSAMAVRKQIDPGNGPLRIEAEIPLEASEDEEFMIFRDDDEEFCPAVNIWGVYSLGAPPKRKGKDKVILPDPLSSVLYLKVSTICRDAVGEAWMFGHVLAHRKRAGPREAGREGDENEVVPDKARGLVFALLSQIVGSASIHYCSKNVFYRKYYSKPGGGSETISSSSTPATSTKNEATHLRGIYSVDQAIQPKPTRTRYRRIEAATSMSCPI